MAEPNSKRVRMDNPSQGSSRSSSLQSRKVDVYPQQEIIITTTQDFEEIRNMAGFVDHTHFIGSFLLEEEPKMAIFAPRRFGKSSHLHMVKRFLEIHLDEKTGEVANSPEERKNFPLFAGTRIITDDKYKNVVQEHLGKHPVIHLDFKGGNIHSFEDATMHCRKVVHDAYLQHTYLINSTKLIPYNEDINATAQNICKKWCDDERWAMQNLRGCLDNLAKYLYNHFNNAKVYILVDEFDSVNANALCHICGNNMKDTVKILRDICDILADMLSSVAKGELPYISGVLITGVSYLSGLGYSPLLNNITKMKFLEGDNILPSDQDFVPFYGATKNEVMSLIQKLVKNKRLVKFQEKEEFLNSARDLDTDKIMADVQSRYNGYFDINGTQIFCLWSVLQYLETGEPINYWNETDGAENLCHIFKSETVAYKLMKLIRGEEIEFERCNKIIIEDFLNLHHFLSTKSRDKADPKIVFNILVDMGFLSYPEGGSQNEKFKLPNPDIRAALSEMLGWTIQNIWEVTTVSCTDLINDISLSAMKDENLLQKKMLKIYTSIADILGELKEYNPRYINEIRITCIMYNILNQAKSFELIVDSTIRDAEGKSITLGRLDFLLLHKEDRKFSILWELKYNNAGTRDKYTTSLHALQEARGIATKRNGKTKKYMESLKKLGREALVIGLSMDSDINVSLSYSSNMEKKIFSTSESERDLYPDLYKTYKPVMLS